MDNGGIWPGDESYFQKIRETALQDTIEQLTKELADARAEIAADEARLVAYVARVSGEIERKDALIEQMREALVAAKNDGKMQSAITCQLIIAALSAVERDE